MHVALTTFLHFSLRGPAPRLRSRQTGDDLAPKEMQARSGTLLCHPLLCLPADDHLKFIGLVETI